MKILGIWDGHDSGAALLEGNRILFAVNEERITRRKLEIAFPHNSIEACLRYTNSAYEEISEIAVSTLDPAKTLTRIFPSLKEEYYLIRRRKKRSGGAAFLKKRFKYRLTEYPPFVLSKWLSRRRLTGLLKGHGFHNFSLHLVDHHFSHAAAAAFCSGYEKSLVITLDGVGDGLSGSISTFNVAGGGKLERIASLPARHSFGIFFEHVTNLMNMRELEDEGKVMALANYAYPVEDDQNPLMDFIEVDGLAIQCSHTSNAMYDKMKKILWGYPTEQFAYMAQRTLEVKVTSLVQNALKATGQDHLCLAGGVFSNVKLNRILRLLPETKACFVFPHMGDGGLGVGAALVANYQLNGIHQAVLSHLFLGHRWEEDEIQKALDQRELGYRKCEDIAAEVAGLLDKGEIVFWFQGAMELGPRALGARSILARPDSERIKDALNLQLKKRVWYQPFCPAMFEQDAKEILEDYRGAPDPFMTMAYMVREDKRDLVRGVINVDNSCRPEIIPEDHPLLGKLLLEVKKLTGHAIVLNTSMNIHGEPLVCSPSDAISAFIRSKGRFMAIHSYLVTGPDA